jgi:hypothetical protein
MLAVAGCGDEPDPTATSPSTEVRPRAVEPCAATLDAMNGARCGHEAAICTFPVACSTFDQQATCTCNEGHFVCSDGVGKIPVGDEARCVRMQSASTEACASTLEEAQGASCETLGHSCAYLGAICPGRPVQNTDTCTCLGDGDGKLVMKCRVAQCNPLYGGPPATPH